MNSGPQLTPPPQPQERNWLPLAIALSLVLIAVIVFFIMYSHGSGSPKVTPVNAPLAPYGTNLHISNLAMSRSSNYIGGQITYVDGHIVNTGTQTVTGITAQVIFRDYTNIVTQNTTEPMQFIRTRTPYVDVEPVSAAPLKPGEGQDFRLAFDSVSSEWNGAYPEIRLIRVRTE